MSKQFKIQTTTSLSNMDQNSPCVSAIYITPHVYLLYTSHSTFIHSLVFSPQAGSAATRAQSGDRYGPGTLHPRQVLRGRLPLLSPAFRRFHLLCQVPSRPTTRETSSSGRWNSSWARNVPTNFGREFDFHVILGIFYMSQICDMGQTALLPLRRKAC